MDLRLIVLIIVVAVVLLMLRLGKRSRVVRGRKREQVEARDSGARSGQEASKTRTRADEDCSTVA